MKYGIDFSPTTKVVIASTNEDEVRQIIEALQPIELGGSELDTLRAQLEWGIELLSHGEPIHEWLIKLTKEYNQ